MTLEIKCPACERGTIHMPSAMLFQGVSFSCDECDATVALQAGSRAVLETAVEAFENLASAK